MAEVLFRKTGSYPRASEIATASVYPGADVEYAERGSHPDFVMRIARLAFLTGDLPNPGNAILRGEAKALISRLRKER